MSNRGGQQVPARPGSPRTVLKLLAVLAAIAVAMTLVVLAWGDTGAATGAVPTRVFLVGWLVAAIVVLVGRLFAGSASRLVSPPVAQHVAMGFVIGLAIGTTDWTALRLAEWWQLWFTVPLLLAYAGLLSTLRRTP